ncbi:MAG: flagellar biosynthesis regulator FlaF [Paracoccaceae bacterium]
MPDTLARSKQAYSAARGTIKTPRSVEYEALAGITARMRSASEKGSAGFSDLASALHENRRIWTVFAVESADEANQLPLELRAGIVSLAGFVQQHSSKVLARSGAIEPLLDVNTAIMRGLRGGGN